MNRRQLHTIGYSVEGRPIELWSDPAGPNGTLIIGGIHADESLDLEILGQGNNVPLLVE